MRKTICSLAAVMIFMMSCSDNDRKTTSNTSDSDIDAARNFIQAALVGDFQKAESFMVNDSLNHEDLNTVSRLNEKLSKEEKEQYRSASIRIHQDRKINDSTSMIYYSNSYANKTDSLKVVRVKGEWLVDFKYFFHKIDSIP